MSDLPHNWCTTKLGELIKFKYGKALPDRVRSGSGFPVYGSNGIVGYHNDALTSGITIIIGRKGSVGEIHYSDIPCSPIDTTYYIDEIPGDVPRYWFYQLKILRLSELNRATAIPGLNRMDAYNQDILLAPLREQKRIADKLDAILARVDACRERLDRMPVILKRFRKAVLAAATSGKLTEDWRESNDAKLKWQILKFAEVGELGRGKSKHRPRNDLRLYGGPYPFIQTGDVAQSRGQITTHSQTYSEFGLAQSKLWPAGTVCITIAANIADTAILTYPACFPDSVVGFTANSERCLPEFIKWTIDVIKEQIESFAPATAQKNINLAILNDIEFHCPPIEEQLEIVRRVETLFSYVDRLEVRYAAVRAQVEKLTPATLAKAFRGELVAQDPSNEPASLLVERILIAKIETPDKPKSNRNGVRSKKTKRTEVVMLTMDKIKPDHLTAILRQRADKCLDAKDLWLLSQLEIHDFYLQLKTEVNKGLLREVKKATRSLLEAV